MQESCKQCNTAASILKWVLHSNLLLQSFECCWIFQMQFYYTKYNHFFWNWRRKGLDQVLFTFWWSLSRARGNVLSLSITVYASDTLARISSRKFSSSFWPTTLVFPAQNHRETELNFNNKDKNKNKSVCRSSSPGADQEEEKRTEPATIRLNASRWKRLRLILVVKHVSLAVPNRPRLVHLKTPHCGRCARPIFAISPPFIQRMLRLPLHGRTLRSLFSHRCQTARHRTRHRDSAHYLQLQESHKKGERGIAVSFKAIRGKREKSTKSEKLAQQPRWAKAQVVEGWRSLNPKP
jgi:hypothetical protein